MKTFELSDISAELLKIKILLAFMILLMYFLTLSTMFNIDNLGNQIKWQQTEITLQNYWTNYENCQNK